MTKKYFLKMTDSVIKLGSCSICGGKGYGVHQLPGGLPTFFCEFHTKQRWKAAEQDQKIKEILAELSPDGKQKLEAVIEALLRR